MEKAFFMIAKLERLIDESEKRIADQLEQT